jgi:hypothetical protein
MSTCQQAKRARRKATNDKRYRPRFKTKSDDKSSGKAGKGGKSK